MTTHAWAVPYVVALGWVMVAFSLMHYGYRQVSRWFGLDTTAQAHFDPDHPQMRRRHSPWQPNQVEIVLIISGLFTIGYYHTDWQSSFGIVMAALLTCWCIVLGARYALRAAVLSRIQATRKSVLNGTKHSLSPASQQVPIILGLLIGLWWNGTFSTWVALSIFVGGYFCGYTTTFLFAWNWLYRQSFKRILMWTFNLARIGWHYEALGILERYADLEPDDYQDLARLYKKHKRNGWSFSSLSKSRNMH